MPSAAFTIAEYVARTRFEDLPPAATAASLVCVQDLLGVALAGATTPWAAHVAAAAESLGTRGAATWWGTGRRGSAVSAALVNGTAAHALDWDDDPGCCHIGAVVIPAAMAEAEGRGASGRELLNAICVGYDVTTRVSDGIDPDRLYQKGYHPTAVCGVFGAAAAVGRLMRLSPEALADALGIAGSFSAGNMEFLSDGAMTKRVQAGKAAADGVLAAHLAGRGFTGPRTILEGPYGLWRYTEWRQTERFTADLGRRYAINEVHFKKHACCLAMAAALDGALELVREHGLQVRDIASIRVGLCPTGHSQVGEPHDPDAAPPTVMAAQMSLRYSLAVCLLDGRVGAEQFAETRLASPEVLDLSRRIEPYVHPALAGAPPDDVTAFLDVMTRDGRTISRVQPTYRGHPSTPMSAAEMEEKFRVCAGRLLGVGEVEQLLSAIHRLPELRTLAKLMGPLRGAGRPGPPVKARRSATAGR
jgi:2-methylcitrate dehydratase PrpD